MTNPSISFRCMNCGMPLAEGPLFTTADKPNESMCGNCIAITKKFNCAFCDEPDATWMFHSSEFRVASVDEEDETVTVYDSGDEWLVCDTCKTYVDADQPSDLTDRVAEFRGWPDGMTAENWPDFKEAMRTYFIVLFDVIERPAEKLQVNG